MFYEFKFVTNCRKSQEVGKVMILKILIILFIMYTSGILMVTDGVTIIRLL